MWNMGSRIDLRLVSNKKYCFEWTLKSSYMSQKIFDYDLEGRHIYVICILDLSKVLMYDFHYDYIKNKYGSNSKLLFTDTDS